MNSANTLNGKVFFQITRFLYSAYYPIAASLWALACFVLNIQTAGLLVMIAAAGLVLVLIKDMSPIIPLFTGCILAIRDFSLLTSAPYIVAYCLLGACFICHFIRFPFKYFYLGKLFFPLCLVSAALFLGGVLSSQGLNYYKNGLVSAFATGPLILVIYLLFLNGINAPENTDVKAYVSYAVIATTVCACIEVFFCYLSQPPHDFKWVRNIGWGNFNTVGALTLMSIPLCCYFMVKTGKFTALFSVIIFMIATDILCTSDGGTGISLFSLPFLAVFVFCNLKTKHRKSFILFLAISAIVVCVFVLLLLFKFDIDEIISFITDRTNENGRHVLYEKAINIFKDNPILGIGQGFSDEQVYEPNSTYNFHSTVFHILATMGIFGIIAYLVYYFFRFKILLGGRSPFNAFAYLSFIMFEAYGLIDVCEFNVVPLMSFMTLIILTAEISNIKGEEKILPLRDSMLKPRYPSL